MEITLEKIELVKDRTGVSYKEAKEALEFAQGNEIDAIIYIEENIDASQAPENECKVQEFTDFVKEMVNQGNVNRIKVFKDDELLLNLPLTIGIVGILLLRWWGIVAAVFATGVCKCRVELVKEDGEIIDVTDKAVDAFNVVKDKGGILADEVVDKGGDLYEAAKAKGYDLYEAVKEKAADFINRLPEEESVDASEINLEEGTEKDE